MSNTTVWRSGNGIVHKWIIINALLSAILAVGYSFGILDRFLVDETYMTHGIGIVFVLFTINSFITALQFRSEWRNLPTRVLVYRSAKEAGFAIEHQQKITEFFSRKLLMVETAGPVLVALGLLGTVVGISIGFSSLGPDVIGNIEASQDAISTLLEGLATAFHTTLIGIAGMIWNMANLHILRQEASRLFTEILN